MSSVSVHGLLIGINFVKGQDQAVKTCHARRGDMKSTAVFYERKGKVGIITFNRPHRLNAINAELIEGFNRALDMAKEDAEARVIILTGEGRSFCAGEDLKESTAGKDFSTWATETEGSQDTQRRILNLGKPMIAAVRGYAVGGGCEFAMACDIRVAAKDAKFGFPETSVGLTLTSAGTKLLPQLIGLGKAKEMVFTGEFIDAETAERWGLVNKVAPGEHLLEEAMKIADKIAEKSPLAVKLSRNALDQGLSASFEDTLQLETAHSMMCIASGDQQRYSVQALERMKTKQKQ